jgi:hypothetical protein
VEGVGGRAGTHVEELVALGVLGGGPLHRRTGCVLDNPVRRPCHHLGQRLLVRCSTHTQTTSVASIQEMSLHTRRRALSVCGCEGLSRLPSVRWSCTSWRLSCHVSHAVGFAIGLAKDRAPGRSSTTTTYMATATTSAYVAVCRQRGVYAFASASMCLCADRACDACACVRVERGPRRA